MLKRAGRYEIIAEIGRGGFGQVYRAFDPTLNSMVAIKTLAVDNDESVLTRFRNEASASRRLHHPNIVTIYDFGEQDGMPFIVMELLEGQDLHRVIGARESLPLLHKIQIMTQVASGLGHAHAHGIVHRDVKPANIMLLPDGNIKIMDFGIARISQDTQHRLTPRGAVIGTFRYMAPEQFRGAEQDTRVDVFAYGLVFYELLSGVHPFHSSDAASMMYNVLNLEPVSILELCPGCPPAVEPLISKLLTKDPDFRYQSLEDVLFDCEPILLELKTARARELFQEAKTSPDAESAQARIRQVLELDPSFPGAREFRERLQDTIRRLALQPKIDALVTEANRHLAAKDFANALQKFESALRLDPKNTTLKAQVDHARTAFDRARQTSRLITDAQRAFQSSDLSRAQRLAQQAVEFAPEDEAARELQARIETALAEQERQARFAAAVTRVRGLLDIRSWNEAEQVLHELAREFPNDAELSGLRIEWETGRRDEEVQRRLANELAASREEIRERQLEAAHQRLVALAAEFPSSADAERLLRYVNSEIEVKRRQERIGLAIFGAQTLASMNRFAEAALELQSALALYPDDPQLRRELRSTEAAQQRAEQDAALKSALTAAAVEQEQGGFDQALAALDAYAAKYEAEERVEDLRRRIEHDREAARHAAQLRDIAGQVNAMLAQGDAAGATKLLQELPSGFKGRQEMTELLQAAETQLQQQVERGEALKQALAGAEAHRRQSDFEQAQQALAKFVARYGADAEIQQLESAIQRDREEARRRAEHIQEVVGEAQDLLKNDKALDATRLLNAQPAEFKQDQQFTQIWNHAAARVREQEQKERAAQEALSAAATFRQRGRFEDSLAALSSFSQKYGADERVAKQEQEILRAQEAALREARIREVAQEAGSLLANQEGEAAIMLLRRDTALLAAPELQELLRSAETAFVVRKNREAIESIVAEAGVLAERQDFQAGLVAIDHGIQRFPDSLVLQKLRTETAEALAEKQRGVYRDQTIQLVGSFLAKNDFGSASRALKEAMEHLRGDARLIALEADLQQQRRVWEAEQAEKQLQGELRRAVELTAARPADAAALLEKLAEENPNRQEIARALEQTREALEKSREEQLIREATQLGEKNQFDAALAKLKQATRPVNGESPAVQAARQQIEARRTELRDQDRRNAIEKIRGLYGQGKVEKARSLYQETLQRYGMDPALEDLRGVIYAVMPAVESAPAPAPPPVAVPAALDIPPAYITAVEARRSADGKPLLLWGALAAAAVVGVGVWILMRGSVAQGTKSKPVAVHVNLRTDPDGASVQVGNRTCVMPDCQLDLAPGRYSVSVRKDGYQPAQQALVVDASGHSALLTVTLQPLPPPPPAHEAGTVVVQTKLPDAAVTVDDAPYGRTDSNGELKLIVDAKNHVVKVQKTGYEVTPADRRVNVKDKSTQSLVFSLRALPGRLEVRGAPAGVEIRAGSTVLGRTDGLLFTANVTVGDQVLRFTQGAASRDTTQHFDPGAIVTLDWSNVAPVVAPPPRVDPAEQEWIQISSTADPAVVQTYLDKYRNGPRSADAQALLDKLIWERTNRNDPASLRAYLGRFPNGVHAQEASAALAQLVWKGVDQSNPDALRAFIDQNPGNPNRAQAQTLLNQLLEKLRVDEEGRKRIEQAKIDQAKLDQAKLDQAKLDQTKLDQAKKDAEKQLDTQRTQVAAVLGRLNSALAQHKDRDVKALWPAVASNYISAVTAPGVVMRYDGAQPAIIAGNTATIICTQVTQSPQRSQSQAVKITLQRNGNDWTVQMIGANR